MYRKFKADYIFTGYGFVSGSNVLITDENGVVQDIIDEKYAGEDIETVAGMLTPGFINCHCHLELSHLKGKVNEKTGLVQFVQEIMSKRTVPTGQKLAAMKTAEKEMYATGIVAVGDICNTADSLPVKMQSKLQWHNFIEVSGFVDAVAQKRLAEINLVREQFLSAISNGRSTLSPHSPYSVSRALFQLLNTATANQLITVHNQECAAENELYKNKSGGFLQLYKNFNIDIHSFIPTGKTSLQSWLPYFTRQQSIISVHNIFTNEVDMDAVGQRSSATGEAVYFCVCPNANKYIEDRLPNIELLLLHTDNLVIGTDSYASNRQLNMLEEIKTILLENPTISNAAVLQWATINGAKALQMQDQLGSFEKGKQPGVVLIEQLSGDKISTASTSRRII